MPVSLRIGGGYYLGFIICICIVFISILCLIGSINAKMGSITIPLLNITFETVVSYIWLVSSIIGILFGGAGLYDCTRILFPELNLKNLF